MARTTKAGRAGPLTHTIAAAALVIAVVVVAYGTTAPSLGIAEFAPSGRAIESPPSTAGDGSGLGGAAGRRRSTTTTQQPTGSASTDPSADGGPPTSLAPRVRTCYGEPPQQLPDSRSPACVATKFEGDNGGVTHNGVSATDIRVAWLGSASDTRTARAVNALFDYFNQHFELYGRRLVPVPVASTSGYGGSPERSRAQGVSIAAENVFAALEPPAGSSLSSTTISELARNKVMSITQGYYSPHSDREVFDPLHPYVWSNNPSADDRMRNLGDFICTSLAGKPASHAGPNLQQKTRKFGIVRGGQASVPSARTLVETLRQCDVEPVVVEWMINRDGSSGLTTALSRLKDAGITTLTCMCADGKNSSVVSGVTRVMPDKPEWLVLSDDGLYDEWLMQAWVGADYRGHAFGPLPYARVAPRQQQWWWRAVKEVDPAIEITTNTGEGGMAQATYEGLLVLATGIQSAGPILTPETFAQGIMSTQFPNNGAGQAPNWLPAAGFGPGDHSLVDDYALAWWSADAEPLGPWSEAGKGSWCYVHQGARFSVGTFPKNADDLLFNKNEACR